MAATQLQNREGQLIPEVSFRVRENGDWKTVTTDELFAGKNVVVFSLPGAFTPTCSSTHLPRFNELAPVFGREGIDRIICVAVNDPFVMEEWGKSQECGNVLLLPDGNGAFTEQMGLMVDKNDLNFGRRSWRYSMLVRDRKIEKMFIEPQKPGDPFEVSDADTMLSYLAPKAARPPQVAILTREGCQFCAKAKRDLKQAGYDYVEIDLPVSIRSKALGAITKAGTVPQVFVDGALIGGSEQLEAWLKANPPSRSLTAAELNRHVRRRAARLLLDESGASPEGIAIYALADPRDLRAPRYIGQTKSPRRRLLQHISQARLWLPDERPWWIRQPRLRPLYDWLRELHRDEGRLPVMVVMEWIGKGVDARVVERARIHEGLAKQQALLNFEREVLARQMPLL